MDTKSRQIIAFHVGDRSRKSARRLWAKIPLAYRQHATFHTDQYVVYEGVIPTAQHRAINKLARTTNHIERFNNTLRQRLSRLVREALSFPRNSPITLVPSSCSSATTILLAFIRRYLRKRRIP
jgi:insertion element IS1 protein InsB